MPKGSYRAHSGLTERPQWLDSIALLRQLAATEVTGRKRYATFVAQGRGIRLWEEALSGQIYLGDERFVAKMQSKCERARESREIPRAQRRGKAQPLGKYLLHRTPERRVLLRPIARAATRRALSPRRWDYRSLASAG